MYGCTFLTIMFCSNSIKDQAWKWPWVVMIVFLYLFCLPWIGESIVARYWFQQDFDATLVGLDDTFARAFFMVGHMSLGAVCLLLGPTQFLRVIRRKWPMFHRISGRVYVLCAVLCSLFGCIFIFLKGFILVGGLNMGIAFFVAGVTFGICAVMAAVYARKKEFARHRNWAIRSYGQILAPMLYRYFYLLLGGLTLYPVRGEKECDEQDICYPFTETFDAIHAWTYFLFPLAVTELIIYVSPKVSDQSLVAFDEKHSKNDSGESNSNVADSSLPDEEQDVEKETGYAKGVKEEGGNSPIVNNYTSLNIIGILCAVFTTVTTILIYATTFAGTNNLTKGVR